MFINTIIHQLIILSLFRFGFSLFKSNLTQQYPVNNIHIIFAIKISFSIISLQSQITFTQFAAFKALLLPLLTSFNRIPPSMPPKLNSTHYTTRKNTLLKKPLASTKKFKFGYNEDMELQFLKKYIDDRKSPRKHTSRLSKNSANKPHQAQLEQTEMRLIDPIQELQNQSSHEDDSRELKEPQNQSESYHQKQKNKKPKVLNKGNNKKNTESKEKKQQKQSKDSKKTNLSKQSKVGSKQKKKSKQSKQQTKPNSSKQRKQQKDKKQSKQLKNLPINQEKKSPKKRTYAQSLFDLIVSRAKGQRKREMTPQEHIQSIEAYMQTVNEMGMDANIPPYYTRMTLRDSEQHLKLIKQKQEIARKVFEENKIYPILFPQPGKITQKMKRTMVSEIDFYERCEKPKETDFSSMYKKIEPKDRNMDDSAYLNQIPELEDESSKYIVQTVNVKLRHPNDLPEYYKEGFKRLYEDIPRGVPLEAYESLEKFNEANFSSFTTLDSYYYIGLDKRNLVFSGYPQTDEAYIEDMPFDLLFPELSEMFGFPERPNNQLAEDSDFEDDEEDQKVEKEGENQSGQGNVNQKEQQILTKEQQYKNYYDQTPMSKDDLAFIKSYITKELEEFKKENLETKMFNEFTGKWTNRWDYYVGGERYLDEKEEAINFLDQSLSMEYSRTQTMMPSKTKSIEPMQRGNKRQQLSKKGNGEVEKNGVGFMKTRSSKVEGENKDKKNQTKTKLREVTQKVDQNKVTDSEGDWEDESDDQGIN